MQTVIFFSAAENANGRHVAGVTGSDEEKSTAKRNLLLVDDDRLILATLSDGLRKAGYQVTTASCSADALEIASRTAFDLAILDVRMPGMDGLELGRRLHEHTRIPFLYFSAYGDLDLVRDAAAHGALGYLLKPVDIPQLVPTIEAALARGDEILRLRDAEAQLNVALAIEQKTRMAVGLLMEREHLNRKDAFEMLRSHARSTRRKIADVAEEILSAAETLSAAAERKSSD